MACDRFRSMPLMVLKFREYRVQANNQPMHALVAEQEIHDPRPAHSSLLGNYFALPIHVTVYADYETTKECLVC